MTTPLLTFQSVSAGLCAAALFERADFRALTLAQIAAMTEDDCARYLANCRWQGDEQQCPECRNWNRHYYLANRRQFTCRETGCQRRFSFRAGTALADCNLSPKQLLKAFHCVSVMGQNIDAVCLAETVPTSQKTARRVRALIDCLLIPDGPPATRETCSKADEATTPTPVSLASLESHHAHDQVLSQRRPDSSSGPAIPRHPVPSRRIFNRSSAIETHLSVTAPNQGAENLARPRGLEHSSTGNPQVMHQSRHHMVGFTPCRNARYGVSTARPRRYSLQRYKQFLPWPQNARRGIASGDHHENQSSSCTRNYPNRPLCPFAGGQPSSSSGSFAPAVGAHRASRRSRCLLGSDRRFRGRFPATWQPSATDVFERVAVPAYTARLRITAVTRRAHTATVC